MGELYKLDFSNGKSYIGITTKTAKSRFGQHRRDANNGSSYAVHRAWRKFGEPTLSLLAVLDDKDLAEAEIRAIKEFGTLNPAGYNITPGGEESPMLVPEIKAKLVGIKRSEETKAKLSKAKKGTMTDSHREKLRSMHAGNSYRLGKPRPDMRGNKNPMRNPETAAKCIAARAAKKRLNKPE